MFSPPSHPCLIATMDTPFPSWIGPRVEQNLPSPSPERKRTASNVRRKPAPQVLSETSPPWSILSSTLSGVRLTVPAPTLIATPAPNASSDGSVPRKLHHAISMPNLSRANSIFPTQVSPFVVLLSQTSLLICEELSHAIPEHFCSPVACYRPSLQPTRSFSRQGRSLHSQAAARAILVQTKTHFPEREERQLHIHLGRFSGRYPTFVPGPTILQHDVSCGDLDVLLTPKGWGSRTLRSNRRAMHSEILLSRSFRLRERHGLRVLQSQTTPSILLLLDLTQRTSNPREVFSKTTTLSSATIHFPLSGAPRMTSSRMMILATDFFTMRIVRPRRPSRHRSGDLTTGHPALRGYPRRVI